MRSTCCNVNFTAQHQSLAKKPNRHLKIEKFVYTDASCVNLNEKMKPAGLFKFSEGGNKFRRSTCVDMFKTFYDK